MAKCERCGKKPEFGHHVSHSKLATRRMFRPNLQRTTLIENGQRRRVQMCTKCLKAMSKTA
jgi:large subunit ribosomal protein L28